MSNYSKLEIRKIITEVLLEYGIITQDDILPDVLSTVNNNTDAFKDIALIVEEIIP